MSSKGREKQIQDNITMCYQRGKSENLAEKPLCGPTSQIDPCRHLILYPLQLRPPFPNDNITLRPKVDLGPNLVKSRLEKLLLEDKLIYGRIILFLVKKRHKNPKCTYTCTCMCTHTQTMCTHA